MHIYVWDLLGGALGSMKNYRVLCKLASRLSQHYQHQQIIMRIYSPLTHFTPIYFALSIYMALC